MKLFIFIITFLVPILTYSQDSFFIRITNSDNGEIIHNAEIYSNYKKCEVVKLNDSIFKINHLKRKKELIIQAIGFNESKYTSPSKLTEKVHVINGDVPIINNNDTLIIYLNPKNNELMTLWAKEKMKADELDTTDFILHPGKTAFFEDSTEFQAQLISNIIYPQTAIENNEQGKVYIGAIAEIDGSLTNFHIKRSVSMYLDMAALKTVKKCNFSKIIPAEKNGKKVRSLILIPINYNLH